MRQFKFLGFLTLLSGTVTAAPVPDVPGARLQTAAYVGMRWSGAAAREDPALQKFLTDWADAWSARDVERYLSFYAPTFRPTGGMSRAAWEAQRRQRMAGVSSIRVELSDIKFEQDRGNRARALFTQRFRSDRVDSTNVKRLVLEKFQHRWYIVEEVAVKK